MSAPAIYATEVRHVRATPLRHELAYRGYCWLVDLDALPHPPWPLAGLARFEARDHLGDPQASLRANVVTFLAEHGIDIGAGRVLMLAQARTLGHVFNPLSVFWCHRADSSVACVLAEVHNTYGERHVYLLHPDAAGRASTDKALYVSPFNPVAGRYQLSLPEPADQLDLTVTLHQPGQRPFVATLRGHARPATTTALLRACLAHPLATRLVALRIRMHGLWLWTRRLPVVRRPPHPAQPGVQAPPTAAAPGAEPGAPTRRMAS